MSEPRYGGATVECPGANSRLRRNVVAAGHTKGATAPAQRAERGIGNWSVCQRRGIYCLAFRVFVIRTPLETESMPR